LPTVPYSPVPDIAPQTRSPEDYFTQQASPSDFGAQVGQAVQGLGQSLGKAGEAGMDVAIQKQAFANKVGSDDAYNKFQTASDKILHGDPNDPNNSGGYYALRGADALSARAGVIQQLEDLRTGIKTGLPTQMMQLKFDEDSRRLNMFSTAGIGAHADQEFNRYATETYTAAIDTKARAVANTWNDPENFQHNLADAQTAADNKSKVAGAPPGSDIFNDNRNQAAQTLYTARAVAMGTANPSLGLAFVQAHPDQFDAITLHRLEDEFKAGSDKQAVAAGISDQMARPVSGGAPASPDIKSAISAQEGKGVSSQGAVEGLMPATFTQYAKPGESFDNPTDRKAVNDRVIDDLSQKFNGDPQRIAVGYFSGPGNVSPPGSANPWLVDKADKDGTTTSSYVSQVMGRLGTGGGTATGTAAGNAPTHDPAPYGQEFARMQQAREHAAELFPNRPDLQRQMIEGVWSEIAQTNALQAKYEAEQAKQQRDGEQAEGKAVVDQLITDPTKFDPATLTNAKFLTYEQKAQLFDLSQKRLHEVQGGKESLEYGPGFWGAYQAVHSADPSQQITDPAQLWPRGGPNGDLSLAGIKTLTAEIEGARTPEGKADAETRQTFLNAAHLAISGHGMMGGARDPVGEMNFARFLPGAFAELEKERSAGMTMEQSLKPGGILDGMVKAATRSPTQMMQDMMGATNPDLSAAAGDQAGGAKPAATAPATLDLTTVPGLQAAYKAGHFGYGLPAYQAMVREAQRRGLVAAPITTTPQVPVN
jgi:hypothetical protein